MTSTLGIKKIQYPNGTNSITIDSSGSADITTANITTAAITTANVTNATATGTITTPSINGSQIGGRRNLIINGAMAVNQRGATSGVTSGYFVDRFRLSGCSASAVITSNTPTEFPTAITVSATSGNPIVSQRVESKNVQHLSGKTVTASFLAKNVSNATTLYVSLAYAGSADSWGSSTTISEQNLGTLTGDWVKYTASWTVPAGGLNGLGLNILCAGSSTFTMGVAGVQMEVGSQATEFEHRSFAEELRLCSRYFWRQYTNGTNVIYFRDNISAAGQNILYQYPAPPAMRINGATVTCSLTANVSVDSNTLTYHQHGAIQVYLASISGDNYLYSQDLSINAEL